MKLYQKGIILLVVFVLALTSIGIIAAAQAAHGPVAVQSTTILSQASGVQAELAIVLPPRTSPGMTPNVSWNS